MAERAVMLIDEHGTLIHQTRVLFDKWMRKEKDGNGFLVVLHYTDSRKPEVFHHVQSGKVVVDGKMHTMVRNGELVGEDV